ncbi:nucleotidyltransferase domain-containing protein [bacterium]|nr:nucleotidyltransferase domain-containing protein [bacterium]MBU1616076.1 nucleotidyltransferase domain-containing protein [bacterium]
MAEIPEGFRQDIGRAVRILKEAGCTDIFVFGSSAEGEVREESDIDLAIRGCPPEKFFHLWGKLLFELEHPVDLVDMDQGDNFAEYLEKEGGLRQVG